MVLEPGVTTRMDRDSDVSDLDFDDQLDAVIEERLSGKPPRAPGLDSSENITVRPPSFDAEVTEIIRLGGEPASERGDRAASNPEFASVSEPAPISEGAARGVGLSWDYLRRQATLPVGVRLRALVEVLSALTALHTDVARSPGKRFHGALWYGNLLFRNDGSALLLKDQSVTPQPSVYAAPELRRRGSVDQQADCYAIGVMLLEALADQSLSSPEVNDLSQGDLGSHPFWGRLAGDPLLWVAVRATAREPARRWPTAREFADALSECAFDRIATREALGQLICAALFEQGDRATPLVSAPVSSRSPLAPPVSPLEARRPALPTSPVEARKAAALTPPARRQSPPTHARPEAAESAGPSVRPSERSTTVVSIAGLDGDSGFGVAVSVAAARVPSFAAEPPSHVEAPPKRRRGALLWALAAVVLTSLGVFVLRNAPLPESPTLAAERLPTPGPAVLAPGHVEANTQNSSVSNSKESAAPATPGVPGKVTPTAKGSAAEPPPSASAQTARALPPGASVSVSAAGKRGTAIPSAPKPSAAEPGVKSAAPPSVEARSGADGRKNEPEKISKPRAPRRYEPDGI